jgi:hypothetical protein
MIYLVPETRIWFGTYTNIEFAPQLAYHITDRWSVGIGPHYLFHQYNSNFTTNNYSTHIWGVRSFSRLSLIRHAADYLPIYLFDELFAHFEYERMNLENQYFNSPSFPSAGRFWGDYLFIGAGINQRLQGNTSFTVLLLWNLNESLNSLYTNPIYRVGISIYF